MTRRIVPAYTSIIDVGGTMRLLLPILLVACAPRPNEGTWTYDGHYARTDECGIANMWDPGLGFELSSAGSSIILDPPYGDAVGCEFTQERADCEEASAGEIALVGATAEVEMATVLRFSAPDTVSGSHVGTVTCTNALCVGAALLIGVEPPCELEISFDARWSSTAIR